MKNLSAFPPLSTVTLNPAIDRAVTIPGFAAGAVNRVEASADRAGGKGINVAATLAAHGYAVTARGFLGEGNAAPFERLFVRLGIADALVRLPGETRVGIKILDPVRKETTDINFPGLVPSAEAEEKLEAQLRDLRGGWCALSGSVPPGMAADVYARWIRMLAEGKVATVLDASGAALRAGLAAGPTVAKPNIYELEEYLGRKLPDARAVVVAARETLRAGGRLRVVSCGADGAVFVTEEEAVRALPVAAEVLDTVGAGDAMVAGILSAQLQELTLAETARHATAFSLAVLTRQNGPEEIRESVAAWQEKVAVVAEGHGEF